MPHQQLIAAPPQPASLSQYNTYTTWPGGIDPTAQVFRTDNQKFGGKRKSKSRKGRKASKKTRKSTRKANFSFF